MGGLKCPDQFGLRCLLSVLLSAEKFDPVESIGIFKFLIQAYGHEIVKQEVSIRFRFDDSL